MNSRFMRVILVAAVGFTAFGQSTNEMPLAPDVEVAREMAAAPTDCGIMPDAVAIDPIIGSAVGTWPIWFALQDGGLFMPETHYHSISQLEGWWVTKAGIFVPLSYTGEVRVRAVNVDDGSPVFIDAVGDLSETEVLNPAQPGGFVDGLDKFAFFPAYFWVSKAGCYRFEAEWEGGRWQQIIPVGHLDL